MAEEKNADNTQSSKITESAFDLSEMLNPHVTVTEEQLQEEDGTLLRSPNDTHLIRPENQAIYQTDVVNNSPESETMTTEQPTEDMPEEMAVEASSDAAESSETATTSETETKTSMPSETMTESDESHKEEITKKPESIKSTEKTEQSTLAEENAKMDTTAAESEMMTKSPGIMTKETEQSKDRYAIDIPLDKKINKHTQRKLWEEIEKRKPLIPKHVAQHIRKYGKPPFETWGCKFRNKGSSCFGCK